MHSCWGACVVARGWGACMVGVGAVCGYQGVCVVAGGVCMVAGEMCVVVGGACVGYDEIRSMSGRYASYWNAFLFILKFKFLEQSIDLPDRHPDCLSRSNQHSGIFQKLYAEVYLQFTVRVENKWQISFSRSILHNLMGMYILKSVLLSSYRMDVSPMEIVVPCALVRPIEAERSWRDSGCHSHYCQGVNRC